MRSIVASSPGIGAATPGAIQLRIAPNPVQPGAGVEFSLDRRGPASVMVFDVQGRRVAVLADREFEPGQHRLGFGCLGLPSGVYWLVLRTERSRVARRIALLR